MLIKIPAFHKYTTKSFKLNFHMHLDTQPHQAAFILICTTELPLVHSGSNARNKVILRENVLAASLKIHTLQPSAILETFPSNWSSACL
jgi:hypothetical protein